MKKVNLVLAIALAAGSLAMGACKSKKDDPVVPPTPPTPPVNPVVPSPDPTPNTPGTANLPAVQTPNTLGMRVSGNSMTVKITGSNVAIDGLAPGQTVDTSGAAKTYQLSATDEAVYIKGGVTGIEFTSPLKAINLSKAPETLKTFSATGVPYTAGGVDLDLSGAVNVEKITLVLNGVNASSQRQDLSKLTKLKNLSFGNWRSDKGARGVQEIVWPSPSSLEVLELASAGIKTFDFSAHPKLKDFRNGGQNGLTELNLENHAEIQRIFIPRVSSMRKFVAKNVPKLSTLVLVDDGGIDHLEIDRAPLLTEPSGSLWGGAKGFWLKAAGPATGAEYAPATFSITNSGISRP